MNIDQLDWINGFPDKEGHWLLELELIHDNYKPTIKNIIYYSVDIAIRLEENINQHPSFFDDFFDTYEYKVEKLPKLFVFNRCSFGGTDLRRFLNGENKFKIQIKILKSFYLGPLEKL